MRVRLRESGERFRRLATGAAPHGRQRLADDLKSEALSQIVATTPVDTGRAQRGWVSAAGDVGEGEGESSSTNEAGRSQRTATNRVPYVVYLEYGTSRMAPREIVRRALRRVAGLAAGLFSLISVESSSGESSSGESSTLNRTADGSRSNDGNF